MIDNWVQFLTDQGANIEDAQVKHFGNENAEKKAALEGQIICDLSHYGLIRASGGEAENFLQNQFCNDVRNISDTQSQLNAYCNPKGRVLAFFRLFQINNQYYLRLPREILADTQNRLQMFVMMSKVTLEDASSELVRIGFSGPDASQRLNNAIDTVPTEIDFVTHTNDVTVIHVSDSPPRFEMYGSVNSIKPIWEKLVTDAKPVGSSSWNLLDINDAIPEVVPETKEAFVPQMINLEGINALSFKKGCYPGQEIVARMHYLGKLKRHMFLAHTDSDTVPAPGDSLYAEGSDPKLQSGQGAGKVVRAESNPNGGTDLVAVIEIASKEKGSLHLENPQGPELKLQPLPYKVGESE
ncbi:MAG: folate-binding protein YgfZ [Gammaproteobacteria bacterium]|nr:folate-binding protein YgfZ [Gammaproteobacteria bacterium]